MRSASIKGAIIICVCAAEAFGRPVAAQEPDTLVTAGDTAQQVVPGDTLQAEPPDTFFRLPSMAPSVPVRFATNLWTWHREDLLSTPAQTLLELLDRIPGVLPLKGGDYGTPEAATAFGLGGGRLRVFWDGFEMLSDAATTDLARIGLGGLERIRVERSMGELRIELESLQPYDTRPSSTVEAGTGDLDTNHFRGTFVHPRALGGSLGLALERVDTRGTRGDAAGSRSGGWVRYMLHRGDRGGLGVEIRQITTKSELDTIFPASSSRSDVVFRGRLRLTETLTVEAFRGSSTVEVDAVRETPGRDDSRSQTGIRAAWHSGALWARGAARFFDGPEVPSSTLELEGGGAIPGLGGAALRWTTDRWEGAGATMLDGRLWTEPVLGVSLFGSFNTGERGVRQLVDTAGEPPDTMGGAGGPVAHRVSDREGRRLGATFARGPLRLSAAWLRVEADSLFPFGLETDRDGVALEGHELTGFELSTRLALPWLPGDGFGLYGSLQQWDEPTRYLPEMSYRAGIDFHEVFLESGNFELWAEMGVRGRDPMTVPFLAPEVEGEEPELQTVPFYQSWDAFLQFRIVSFRLFVRFENLTVRENLQDFPGRIQPFTRATYGVRWVLWN